MSMKEVMLGIMALGCAMPVAAQERGTMEFGAFASAATFDNALSLKTGFGGGGRVGMFLDPRTAIEFEDGEMRVSRPNGLRDVNAGMLAGRLVVAPFTAGKLSLLVGAGAGVSTETNFLHSYGVDALAGVKYAMSENAALRLDGVWDFLAHYDYKSYKSIRLGLSLFRQPSHQVVTVVTPAPPPIMMAHEDSVSSGETRRLRESDAALRALRDSLRAAPVPMPAATPAPAPLPRAKPDQNIPIKKDVPLPKPSRQG